jgi:hypothetical protein
MSEHRIADTVELTTNEVQHATLAARTWLSLTDPVGKAAGRHYPDRWTMPETLDFMAVRRTRPPTHPLLLSPA